jgi:hypothetical protein
MVDRIRNIAALSLAALAGGLTLSCAAVAASGVLSPLPRSDYTVRALCSAPRPGRAGCLSLELRPRTAAARAHTHPLGVTRTAPHAGKASEGAFGLTPHNLEVAYQLPSSAASTQTIALVDAYNDPTAEADLNAYSKEFGLPECTGGSGCFKQVNQIGSAAALPFPKTVKELKTRAEEGEAGEQEAEDAVGWGVEISLDIEAAHAVCEHCNIVLVEAKSPHYTDLEAAEQTAGELGATEISNSWGGPEAGETIGAEKASPFNRPGTVITASSGDDGYLNWGNVEISGYANFPASSPHVVAVGGTRLELSETTGEWESEAVWNGNGAGGGGCSEIFPAPAWQQNVASWSSVGCGGLRAVADVSADADPYTGIAVRDSTPGSGCDGTVLNPHWCTIGGTSLAAPLIAAVFALAGGAGGVEYPARTLYENELAQPASLHDVTAGSNGECSTPFSKETGLSGCTATEESEASKCAEEAICLAKTGYDGPTGVGTPQGLKAFEPTGVPDEPEPEPGPGPGGGGGGGGGQPSGTTSGTTSGAPAGSTTPPTPLAPQQVHISALALTLGAVIALNGNHPKVSQIGFAFTINASTTVRVTVSKRVHVHHHARWKTLGRSTSATALPGRNAWRLTGHGKLRPGRYRITLTPLHAAAQSLVFSIG